MNYTKGFIAPCSMAAMFSFEVLAKINLIHLNNIEGRAMTNKTSQQVYNNFPMVEVPR